jgi:hypothetical protein
MAPSSRMTFGIFLAPFHRVGENPTLALERDLELLQWLDHPGYDEAWIGEHHSAGWETMASLEVCIAVTCDATIPGGVERDCAFQRVGAREGLHAKRQASIEKAQDRYQAARKVTPETGLHISGLDHVCPGTTAVLPRDSCLGQATANRHNTA